MKTFITLTSVKINNTYNYYKNVVPTVAEKTPAYHNGETWLNMTTGYSYQLIDEVAGTWIQIEQSLDARILATCEQTVLTVLRYLSNAFTVDRNKNYSDLYMSPVLLRNELFKLYNYESIYSEFTFTTANDRITPAVDGLYGDIVDTFKVGDAILISGSKRNNGYYTVKTVNAAYLETVENITSEIAEAFIFLAIIPDALIQIVGRMVWYNIYKRPVVSGMQSERIGSYSYTLQAVGGMGYPEDIIGDLNNYACMGVGGMSVFTE